MRIDPFCDDLGREKARTVGPDKRHDVTRCDEFGRFQPWLRFSVGSTRRLRLTLVGRMEGLTLTSHEITLNVNVIMTNAFKKEIVHG